VSIAANVVQVRERVAAAIARRGAGPEVVLVGVGKLQPASALREAAAAGLLDIGENYAQELRDKRRELADLPIRWHFIGPVQSNKVKYVVGSALVHAVDRVELVEALDARADREGVDQDVLVQVNVAGEVAKHGVRPSDVTALLDRFADCRRLHCRGLMLIPPLLPPEATRPHFAELRRLRDALLRTTRPRVELRILSMGMSADFEVAIEEGATHVRVGTALFGARPSPASGKDSSA
jgi:pyridoxal phosphate enzyme (YggS family)